MPKVATQWNSGATRDSNPGPRLRIPSALTTKPLSHTKRCVYAGRFTDVNEQTICESLLSPTSPKHYWPIFSYNASKACNILLTDELRRRLSSHGVLCLAVHPGNVVATRLSRHWWLWRLIFALVRPFAKSKVRVP